MNPRQIGFIKFISPRKLAVLLIKSYKLAISPYLGNRCRFYPTCSEYAMEAFEKKGFFKGIYYTVRRLLRCNPFFEGGYDPLEKSRD